MYELDDTITALATPAGVGAISVIRVSGKGSISAIDGIFSGKVKLHEAVSHSVHYGKIIEKEIVIDDVLVSIFRSPNSYTGEDSVEISTHGNPFIIQKILNLLIDKNVRLAEPGEFTKRAFLNGRIDLSQAEAVADVINARTEASLKGARNQLDGLLSSKIKLLRDELIKVSSLLELELDFAEEDLEFVNRDEINGIIRKITDEISNLLASYSYGKVIRDGVNVAIVGIPNVGKSSLLNYLLKESRAIVSEIPGTTRDIIREESSINGILFKFFDTAGIRLTDNPVEKEGVLRSREAVRNADIVLLINDVLTGFSVDLYNQLLEITSEDRILSITNKIDLGEAGGRERDIKISALTGAGIPNLLKILSEKVFEGKTYSESSAIVTNLRHYKALEDAKKMLEKANDAIKENLSGEYVAADLRTAENSIGEIIGAITTENILNNIFDKFCIGK